MLPLKLVSSLVLGDPITTLTPFNHHHQTDNKSNQNSTMSSNTNTSRIPLMLFIPTNELVQDSYRLATLARDIGMNLSPNPSLSHLIFSWPHTPPNDVVPLPFPSLSTASLSHLRLFTDLSKGFFKLVFLKSSHNPFDQTSCYSCNNNWDVTALFLVDKKTGVKIDSLDKFSRTLLGVGWTLFKSKDSVVYLYRRLDLNRVHFKCLDSEKGNGNESCRVRELRLPKLDFKNVPLRILQYILLMTDDIFYLA